MFLLFMMQTRVPFWSSLDHKFYFSSVDLALILNIFEFSQRIFIAVMFFLIILQTKFVKWIFREIDVYRATNFVNLSYLKSTFSTSSITGEVSTLLV